MRSLDKVFEYNQHFVAMMNIINLSRLNPPESGHNHHIIPKCWFKLHNLPVDNSKDNLVLLTPEDHQKVHRLCVLCVKEQSMKSKMIFAVHRLHGSMCGVHHTEDTRKKMSKSRKGKVPKNLDALHKAQIGMERSEITKKRISEGRKGVHTGGECFKGMKWKVVNNKRVWYKVEE